MALKSQGIYSILAKVIMVGDSGVGKTCLLLRFCDSDFILAHTPTVGIDFKLKTLEVDNRKIKLQIWDTAGQERFQTITQTYYKDAHGMVLMYACNDRESFNSIENWMKQIKTFAKEDVSIVLVGNKSEMADRKVTYEEAQNLADTYGIKFVEASSKNSKNVDKVFSTLGKEMMTKMESLLESRGTMDGNKNRMIDLRSSTGSVTLSSADKKEGTCTCCFSGGKS